MTEEAFAPHLTLRQLWLRVLMQADSYWDQVLGMEMAEDLDVPVGQKGQGTVHVALLTHSPTPPLLVCFGKTVQSPLAQEDAEEALDVPVSRLKSTYR